MSVGMLILRVVVGLLFMGHGAQKLFGWFGGGGRAGTEEFLGSLGYRSPRELALVGGLAELLGGALVFLGLFTPLGSALLVGMMVAAILAVHVRKGLWNTKGGIEFPLVMMTAATAIAFGPGRYSIDRALDIGLNGRLGGVLALGVGVVAGVVAEIGWRSDVVGNRPADEPTLEQRPPRTDTGRRPAA